MSCHVMTYIFNCFTLLYFTLFTHQYFNLPYIDCPICNPSMSVNLCCSASLKVSREIKKATRKKKATKDNHNNNSTNNLSNINGGQKKAKKAHTGIAVKSGRGAGTANAAPSLSGGGSSNGGGGNSKKGVFDEAWNVITMPENLRDTEAVVAKLADLGLQRSDQLEYLDINDDDTDELLCLLKTVPRKEFLSKLNAALTN